MLIFPLANANASVISATSTATPILTLIDTAGSTRHAWRANLDALDITPENGDIRIVIDPSATPVVPTTTKGFLIKQGATFCLRFFPLKDIRVIATSGTVSCSLQVGSAETGEVTAVSGGGGAITSIVPGTGATNLGKAEDSAHASGDVGVMTLAVRQDTPATTAADGDYDSLKIEGLKGLRVTQGSLISGESQARNRMLVVDGGTSTRITTATTTVCRNASGRLNGVYVEVALTGTATFYDNASSASGTTPWILPIGTVAGWHEFRGATMSNGVVCVTSAADRLVVNTDA
jgi:hypothetical protein